MSSQEPKQLAEVCPLTLCLTEAAQRKREQLGEVSPELRAAHEAVLELLRTQDACAEALAWAGDKDAAEFLGVEPGKPRTAEQLFHECPRGEWVLWWAREADVSRQLRRRAAAGCIRLTLPCLPEGEPTRLAQELILDVEEGRDSFDELHAAIIRERELGGLARAPLGGVSAFNEVDPIVRTSF